jgi:hypothetical protein
MKSIYDVRVQLGPLTIMLGYDNEGSSRVILQTDNKVADDFSITDRVTVPCDAVHSILFVRIAELEDGQQ